MDERVRRLAEQLLDTGLDKLSERERRVITRVAERSQISRDVNSAFDEKQTFGDRLADRVARFGGSWTFIILFLSTLVAWAVLNSVVLAWYSTAFDPYPYIFLNLMLSMLAALQAPVILMSQNRQAARDRLAHSCRRRGCTANLGHVKGNRLVALLEGLPAVIAAGLHERQCPAPQARAAIKSPPTAPRLAQRGPRLPRTEVHRRRRL